MQYFGIPTCPYCKKRVNLIRTWSLRKQGEFQCPRCGGISNIYLSPLIYVVALLALFAGGAVYFFHKFVLDDISLDTALQVFLPFAIFFFLSIFFVYLAKPVIKKVSREEMARKKFGRKKADGRMAPAAPTGGVYYDQEDAPVREYTASQAVRQPASAVQQSAPVSQPVARQQAVQQPRPNGAAARSAAPVRMETAAEPQRPLAHRLDTAQAVQRSAPAVQQSAPQPERYGSPSRQISQAPQGTVSIRPPLPVNRRPAQAVRQPVSAVQQPPTAEQSAQAVQQSVAASPVASRVEVADDFFAKYDDPEYIQRRLREMKDGK